MKIICAKLSKKFDGVTALEQVSLEIASGELFFLLGPSGCGKTTLLRILAGLEKADQGALRFNDIDVKDLPVHKRDTAMVFQGYALWPHMTVAENVAFGLQMKHLPETAIADRVQKALDRVQIADLARRKPNQLSGGQQQRVALARTLVVEPKCLLMDEPLANLDAKLRGDMRAEIRQLCKDSGLTAVYVTHDRKEALSMADRLAVMQHGHVLQVGTPREVYTRPRDPFVAGFIGESNFIQGTLVVSNDNHAVVDSPLGKLKSTVPLPAGVNIKDPILICIRPETCIIDAAVDVPDNSFSADIKRVTYLGELAEYEIEANGQIRLRVFVLNPQELPHCNASVTVHIPPEDVVLLRTSG